jgi:hypothetical protein
VTDRLEPDAQGRALPWAPQVADVGDGPGPGHDPPGTPMSPADEAGGADAGRPAMAGTDLAQATAAGVPVPPVVGARALLGASFDELNRSTEVMRRASFYIGAIVLGTVGPFALAVWAIAVLGSDLSFVSIETFGASTTGVWLGVLGLLAFVGIVAAAVESQAVAIALLGARIAGRPVSIREAVQRSRMSFWRLIAASALVGIPIAILQRPIDLIFGEGSQAALVVGLIVAVLIQGPFMYAPAGIVLGGVGAVEALRRSVRVFRARRRVGLLVAILPTAFQLLLVFGLGAGLDVVFRIVSALGLGTDSGTVGLSVLTVILVAGVFALGTLVFTASAIIVAPQVVMFVGLTWTTVGLDAVRPGGSHAAEGGSRGHRFRWLTRPMVAGFALGAVGLALAVSAIGGG